MKYLDTKEENNILDEVVISKFENFPKLLDIIILNPRISQNQLKEKSKYSGGKIYHTVKALKLMKLVQNGDGNGLTITDLGREISSHYSSKKKIPAEIIKMACLNVPLFKKIYETNIELKDQKQLFTVFENELKNRYAHLNPKFIGAVVRRYLMGIHNINLRAGARMGYDIGKVQQSEKKYNDGEAINALKRVKETLRLSHEDIMKFIDSLPEEKRKELNSKVYSKVFK